MKLKRIFLVVAAMFPMAVLCPSLFAIGSLHVSPLAAPGGDGSVGAPFQSLVQARDRIRVDRESGKLPPGEPIVVLLGPGDYRIGSTFDLESGDGGAPGAPVTYRSETPGAARVFGGQILPAASFHPVPDGAARDRLDPSVRNRVVCCELPDSVSLPGYPDSYIGPPPAPWLYFGGRQMPLARWPNADAPGDGWSSFSKVVDTGLPREDSPDPEMRKLHPGSFVCADPRASRWNLDEGVWLMGYWTHDWAEQVIRVAEYQKDTGVITLSATHPFGIMAGSWGGKKERRFFAFNTLDELDAPGEWYVDRKARILYFYPPSSPADTAPVLATITAPLLRIQDAKHIRFEGIRFEYGHASGVALERTEDIELAGCVVANVAGSGISVSGKGNVIRSCDLFDLGGGGIVLSGGNRKTLELANNLAVNNHIYSYGRFKRTYAAGIVIDGCGQIARNNLIHDAPHNAIHYSGNEHLIELNETYRVVLETHDASAFYTGRDWASQGNIIRHNFIHDLGTGNSEAQMGIYIDDCDSGDTIEGNVLVRTGVGIFLGGGRDNPVLNNLVIDCAKGVHLDGRGMRWKQWNAGDDPSWHLEDKARALNYTQTPWRERYPRLAAIMQEEPRLPLNDPIERNVFVNCAEEVCELDTDVQKILDRLKIASNLVVNTTGSKSLAQAPGYPGFEYLAGTPEAPIDLGFQSARTGNYTLRKSALLLQKLPSFQAIPFEKIGLFRDEYRRQLPERERDGGFR